MSKQQNIPNLTNLSPSIYYHFPSYHFFSLCCSSHIVRVRLHIPYKFYIYNRDRREKKTWKRYPLSSWSRWIAVGRGLTAISISRQKCPLPFVRIKDWIQRKRLELQKVKRSCVQRHWNGSEKLRTATAKDKIGRLLSNGRQWSWPFCSFKPATSRLNIKGKGISEKLVVNF